MAAQRSHNKELGQEKVVAMKKVSIIIWAIAVLSSFFLLGFRLNTTGVEITYVSKTSPFYGELFPGYRIYEINGTRATPELVENFNGNYVEMRTDHGMYYKDVNGTLGLDVKPVRMTKLRFGLDIEGGVRALVEPQRDVDANTLQRIISTLELRINTYGLKETTIRPIIGEKKFIEIEMAGGTKEELKDLIETQGKFEAKIPLKVENGESFKLDSEHIVTIENGTVYVDGSKINETIDGLPVEIRNVTDDYVILGFTVFTGEDVKQVYTDPQHAGIQPVQDGYRFSFQILISNKAAQNFAKVTQNLNVVPEPSGEGYLDSKIELYLDEKLVDSLSIAAGLKGRAITTPAITGFKKSQDDAVEAMRKLQSILNSGSLPVEIKIVSMDEISPKLGSEFLKQSLLAGLTAFVVISLMIFIRYRDPKFVLPVLIFSFSEVVMTLGTANLIGQTIDLPAIAGLIAAIGTSVDDQIMIIDEVEEKKEELSLKQRIKRALTVIFGSAGTTIAALFPLMFVGFGVLRGFAIVGIIGILVSVLISRPAFNTVVSEMAKKRE